MPKKRIGENRESLGLRFLYQNALGRFFLKGLIHPSVSKICGKYMDSGFSKWMIPQFIQKNHIDLSEYQDESYHCFNDCFCRRILPEKRPIDQEKDHLIAPCDGLLTVYPISGDTVLPVKQAQYTLPGLLCDSAVAERFENGYCLIFRLCVNHYHRYCYVDDGVKGKNHFIAGKLHTVRPIALVEEPVFTQNAREYTLIHSENFGTMLQMEVGAMLVGRIVNHDQACYVNRGQEKGCFLYGGSTIILLLQKEAVKMRRDLTEASVCGIETPVKMGEMIGIRDILDGK